MMLITCGSICMAQFCSSWSCRTGSAETAAGNRNPNRSWVLGSMQEGTFPSSMGSMLAYVTA